MSDELIRALARQWAVTNADEDGVSYITAQLRAGALSEERVALAAYLGSSAAMAISGRPPEVETLVDWGKGLQRWDAEVRVRVARAALDLLDSPNWNESPFLRAVEDWLLAPTQPGSAESEAIEKLATKGPKFFDLPEVEGHSHRVRWVGTPLFRVQPGNDAHGNHHAHGVRLGDVMTTESQDHSHPLGEAFLLLGLRAHLSVVLAGKPFSSSLRVAELILIVARFLGQGSDSSAAAERVWKGIAAEVTPWALGLADPRLEAIRARPPQSKRRRARPRR